RDAAEDRGLSKPHGMDDSVVFVRRQRLQPGFDFSVTTSNPRDKTASTRWHATHTRPSLEPQMVRRANGWSRAFPYFRPVNSSRGHASVTPPGSAIHRRSHVH